MPPASAGGTPPMTPNTEALVEQGIAEKQRRLLQLRQQAQALEEQITRDGDRLSTARSQGRRNRTALLGADSFTPRPQTGTRARPSTHPEASARGRSEVPPHASPRPW